MTKQTNNLRISNIFHVDSPALYFEKYPITDNAIETVSNAREGISNILHDRDDRLLVVVGPCSIHDPKAAMEYAHKLKLVNDQLKNELLIVMRVYFEKPRTHIGWKGLINDPNLDETFDIGKGLGDARKLLLDINDLGLPTGTEYLDLISPQYIADLVSWGAIGARTTESQGHRELASGVSCPIGFKNGTDGTMNIAVDAMRAAAHSHHFMSLTAHGKSAIFSTKGNDDTHIILRGGSKTPNYAKKYVDLAVESMIKAGVPAHLMIDLSHSNSEKKHQRQLIVGDDVAQQISNGDRRIIGVMIESHLVAGNQAPDILENLTYGQSITDACISWDDTTPLLEKFAEAVKMRRQNA